MRRFARLLILFSCGVMCAANIAQARPASAQDEVVAADHARADALLHQDFAAIDKIMADDVVFCHGSGMIDTKATYMAALHSDALHYYAIDGSGIKVRMIGNNAAVFNGPLLLKVRNRTPEAHDVKLQATEVYEKRDGRWQLISYQTTALPAAASVAPAK